MDYCGSNGSGYTAPKLDNTGIKDYSKHYPQLR